MNGSHQIVLTMNGAATASGAFNTQTKERFSLPFTITEKLYIPCDASGNVENWPAFWLDEPGDNQEIDVFEGQGGVTDGDGTWTFHYHAGASKVTGDHNANYVCGDNQFRVSLVSYHGRPELSYWQMQKSVWVREATIMDICALGAPKCTSVHVHLHTTGWSVINDYMACNEPWCGPVRGGVSMKVETFSARRH